MPDNSLNQPHEPAPDTPGDIVPEPSALQFDLADYLPEAIRPAWETLVAYPWLLVPLLLVLGWAVGKALEFSFERG